MLDLEPIKARESEATTGPWVSAWECTPSHTETLETVIYNPAAHDGEKQIVGFIFYDKYWAACSRPNAAFIASAREDIPALVAELERLRTALLAEREACAQIAESFIPSGFRGGDHLLGDAIGIARDDRARTIADAIRQRGTE